MARFNIWECFCIPHSETEAKNEDRVDYGNNFLFVIDGATRVSGRDAIPFASDAEWFAERVREELKNNLNDCSRSIQQILKEAMEKIKREFDEAGINDGYPSAACFISRINGNKIEVFRLGDCLGMVRMTDGKVYVSREIKLTRLDDWALVYLVKSAKEHNVSVKEAYKYVLPILAKNRQTINTSDGYWILEPTGMGIANGAYEEFDKDKVLAVTAMTDGFWGLVDTYRLVPGYVELMTLLERSKGAELQQKLFKLQDNDPDWNAYPRFKFRDDTSLIFATLD